ncbi:hypothetical protein Xmau_03756 [Xenorhabdus mauleonii]|uniref:Uncharacterized protein n=1 Tax=Xenorhabdus mauleonii TaxID=351675 RepID=A0A1I3YBR8_9GAMM|nr:hypothetical protein [Xenorhabdus mauleonii]PHM37793.1 hypothetical protein Xmau_03756 [Xenorhabdus mauleonii]SFK28819.1 hypothetical protein SAMN05421680_14810 [Xenorhabdus mauleonii]
MLKKIKEFRSEALIFFIISVFLSLLAGRSGGGTSKEVATILMESLAPRTILFLTVLSMVFAALVLFFYGKHAPDKKINNFLYVHIIYKLTKLGRSLSSIGIAIFLGLLTSALAYQELKISIEIIVTIVTLTGYWTLLCLVDICAEKGIDETISLKYQKLVLGIIFFTVPFVYVLR